MKSNSFRFSAITIPIVLLLSCSVDDDPGINPESQKVNSTQDFSVSAPALPLTVDYYYCTAKGSIPSPDFNITKVTLFNSVSSGENNGYVYHTSTAFGMFKGGTAQIKLEASVIATNLPAPLFESQWNVYVDYNNDLDFNDLNENIGEAFSPSETIDGMSRCEILLHVPASTSTGIKRMRIIFSKYGNFPTYPEINPCSTGFVGEVEDFKLNVL